MEKKQEKIQLYRSRDFAGNFDTAFAFIKQNYLQILKAVLWFVPLMLLVSFFMPNNNDIMESMENADVYENPFAMYEGVFTLGFFVSYFLIMVAMYLVMLYTACYMYVYSKSIDGRVNSSEVWSKVFDSLLPIFVSSIIYGILVSIGTLLCFIPGIIVAVYLYFYMFVYIVEGRGIIDSLSRSYELVQNNWWVTFGYMIVFWLISYIVSIVFSLPSLIAMIGGFLHIDFLTSDIFYYISNFISYAGSMLVYPVMYIAMGVMYFSHRNKLEGIDMETEIDNIGGIGNNPENTDSNTNY